MDTNSLQKLRAQIIERAQALALSGQVNEDDKLAILMNLVRTGAASDEVVKGAFDAIDHLPDDDVKLETYFDLLYEVDQLIARNSTPKDPTPESNENEPQQDDGEQSQRQTDRLPQHGPKGRCRDVAESGQHGVQHSSGSPSAAVIARLAGQLGMV